MRGPLSERPFGVWRIVYGSPQWRSHDRDVAIMSTHKISVHDSYRGAMAAAVGLLAQEEDLAATFIVVEEEVRP